ncbi:MAG: type II toxin-antitoxin system HigA family antitoxin [Crocosphaera sp.]
MTLTINQDIYNELLVKFHPKVIETEVEYQEYGDILIELMMNTNRSEEETAILKLISALIKEYDQKQEQPEPASPHEILQHLMEEHNMKQVDLVGQIGSKGVVSEVVNGKRSISKSQAKTLTKMFHVSPALFI